MLEQVVSTRTYQIRGDVAPKLLIVDVLECGHLKASVTEIVTMRRHCGKCEDARGCHAGASDYQKMAWAFSANRYNRTNEQVLDLHAKFKRALSIYQKGQGKRHDDNTE